MAKELTVNVVVLDDKGAPVLLSAGDHVPSEYADQVGGHCYTETGTSPRKQSPARTTK